MYVCVYIYIMYIYNYLYIISIPRIHKDNIYIYNKSQVIPWWWDIPIPSLSQVCSILFDRSWHSSSAALGGVEAVLFDPQGCRGSPWKICDEWNGDEWWWMVMNGDCLCRAYWSFYEPFGKELSRQVPDNGTVLILHGMEEDWLGNSDGGHFGGFRFGFQFLRWNI